MANPSSVHKPRSERPFELKEVPKPRPISTYKWIPLVGRVLFSSVFILGSFGHFTQGYINMAAQNGMPAASVFVPLSGVLALVGGLSILTGYRARQGAWLLVLFLVPVTLVMHNFWSISDPAAAMGQKVNFMKNLAMLGGALLIAYFGSGPLSVDHRHK